jgi:hypothetical protein
MQGGGLQIEPVKKRLLFEQLERRACENRRHSFKWTEEVLKAAGVAATDIKKIFQRLSLKYIHCDCVFLKHVLEGAPP